MNKQLFTHAAANTVFVFPTLKPIWVKLEMPYDRHMAVEGHFIHP